jgi:hypothetical protein
VGYLWEMVLNVGFSMSFITHRTAKEYRRKQVEVNSTKGYIKNDENSR